MARCPHCHELLSDESLHSKTCGACGVSLGEDAPVDERSDGGDSTEGDFSVDEGDAAAEQPYSQTIESSSLPDDVVLPSPEDSTEGDFTVDEGDAAAEQPYSQTIESSSLPDDVVLPSPGDSTEGDFTVDEGDAAAEQPYSQTIESSSLPDDVVLPSPADSTEGDFTVDEGDAATEQPYSQTIDSSSLPEDAVPPNDGSGTVTGLAANQTVGPSLEEPHAEVEAEHRINQTVESIDLPAERGIQGDMTVHERPIHQTVDSLSFDPDSDSAEPPKGPTVDDRGPQATMDSTSLSPDLPKGQTVRQRDIEHTFDSCAVDGSEADRINAMWGKTAHENASPQMTIHGLESKAQPSQSSLVIQQRAILEHDSHAPDARADYDILSKLGQGGMGVVYAARQASIDRTVAVKMLKPEGAADPNQRNKFLSEAVITGELEHPNIVPIYDLGHNDENALFYAMKRVQGTPWDDVIKGKLLAENLEIFMKTCDAVAFGHSRGIIHRDLKPENTMLGDYGEVLVMDWGLALPYGEHATARTVKIKASMGGTPAYMAPEMATGPFDKMGPASDIYLLGAILFEIVTGRPPHQGKDVMKCLFAAAKNEIVKTDVTGELVDIAHKAMETKIQDRFARVQDLQDAIRQYQEHSESIAMATRAEEELAAANESDDYEGFSRAVFGYHEAYTLWDGNHRAERGMSQAKLAYASSACRKGDLDLALSLVDAEDETHQELQNGIFAAQRERGARTYRLRRAKQAVIALLALVLVGGTVGLVAINYQRNLAVVAYDEAESQRKIAKQAQITAEIERDKATSEKQRADDERDKAENEKERADEERDNAKAEQVRADKERDNAKAEQIRADKERDNALVQEEKARAEQEIAEYETYVALIGLAGAKIEENAFDSARELLLRCDEDLQNWEWGRLMHLCNQSAFEFEANARVNATDFAPDGRRFVTGSWNGIAHVWQKGRQRPIVSIKHDGLYVYAVAWSPTQDLIATGSNSPSGFIRLADASTGKTVRVLKGHKEPVLSVAFSPDGDYLLSTSLDNTARLWDVKTGKETRPPLIGHNWWVWDAAFSPDGQKIVTASHDGTAMMWPVAANEPATSPASESGRPATSRPRAGGPDTSGPAPPAETQIHRATFSGHTGPVYAVAYSPDGQYVVSGGYDKQVLLWQPDDVKPFDYQAMVDGEPAAPKFKLLGTHAAAVRSVTFSHDGKIVVSAGHDNTIKLWHVESGQLLEILRGHGGWVRDCAISPDDKWVLSGGYDKQAKLWSIDGYEEVRVLRGRVLRGHSDAVMSAAFSAGGDKIVTASRDRSAKAYSTADGSELASYVEGHSFLASTAQFFANGTRLMTAAVDNTVRIWAVETGAELRKIEGTGIAAAATVSGSGRWILSGSQGDQRAKLWEVETGRLLNAMGGHKAEVTAVAFSPDERLMFTGDANGRGVLWDRASGRQLQQLRWHTSKITAAAFLPDGSRLLTASDDKTVCPWRISTSGEDVTTAVSLEQLVLKHKNTVWSLNLSRDGLTALTSCEDGRLRLWDLASAAVVREVAFEPGSLGFARLAPDGRSALTVHHDARTVRQWDLSDGREILAPASNGVLGPVLDLNLEGGLVWTAEYTPDGHAILTVGGNEARLWSLGNDQNTRRQRMSFSPHGEVAAASFSPDGSRVVTASWDMTARIWDAELGRDLLKLDGHTGYVNSAVFSPGGKRVLTASDDKTAIIWDAGTGQIQITLAGHGDRVRSAVFSEDGKLIVTGCEDKIARIWNAQDGTLVQELRGHEFGIASAAFSRDKKYVITGSDDNSARIWNVETGDTVHVMGSHTAAVTSVAFSPDGLRALTASEDFTAKLWDTANGREILNLKGHTQEVTSVSFSEDGRYALTSSRDGTAIMWLTFDWRNGAQAE